jgi:hypothetical protein
MAQYDGNMTVVCNGGRRGGGDERRLRRPFDSPLIGVGYRCTASTAFVVGFLWARSIRSGPADPFSGPPWPCVV